MTYRAQIQIFIFKTRIFTFVVTNISKIMLARSKNPHGRCVNTTIICTFWLKAVGSVYIILKLPTFLNECKHSMMHCHSAIM